MRNFALIAKIATILSRNGKMDLKVRNTDSALFRVFRNSIEILNALKDAADTRARPRARPRG